MQERIDKIASFITSKMEFKKIDTSKEKGLKEVEKLIQKGWSIQSVGFNTIELSKGKSSKY